VAKVLEQATRAVLIAGLKRLGYRYITVDLEGFRSGSLNEVLEGTERTQS
jgi:uncharacterized protein